MGWIARLLRNNVWELVAGLGVLALFAGLWLVYPPAALIVTGLGAIALGLWGASKWVS